MNKLSETFQNIKQSHSNIWSGGTEQYDTISFDLFDTLIMRQVLFSSEIFDGA